MIQTFNFNDNLTYRLIPGSEGKETESLALPNSIKVDQAEDGSVVLDLIPPRGITSVIEQQFKLLASDRLGSQQKPIGSLWHLHQSPRKHCSHVEIKASHSRPHKETLQRKIQWLIFNQCLI